MIIECTNCHARYQYSEERFEGKPSKKIKCAKCQTVFEIINPAMAAKAAHEETISRHDQTNIARAPKPPDEGATGETPSAEHLTGRQNGDELQMPARKRLSLAIINGKDAGTVFRIEKPRITVGRSNADLILDDTEASRQHAALEVRDTTYILNDLSSTNGTMVDGRRISTPTELQDKSEFQIGGTTLMLIVTDES